MAELTYNIFTGELVARSDDGQDSVIAHCVSGFSNRWWDSSQKLKGKHGKPGYVPGGPIPIGRWQVHKPGSPHPDGGQRREHWIPVGPVGSNRTLIYIHPAGTTEGCIAVEINFDRVWEILRKDGGGWINVYGGDLE
jgi:hypothetical protein